nr:hypothetical protein [Pseudodesulfovibrio sp.]
MIHFKYTDGTIGAARQVASNEQVYPASYLVKRDDETEDEWIGRIATIGVTPVEYEAWTGDLNIQDKGAPVETMTDGWLVISYPNPVDKVPVWHTSTREQMFIMPDSPLPPGYTNLEPEDGEYSR